MRVVPGRAAVSAPPSPGGRGDGGVGEHPPKGRNPAVQSEVTQAILECPTVLASPANTRLKTPAEHI